MKKSLISILVSVLIISIFSISYATTGNISLTTTKASVLKGETFTVTLAGTADNNITGVQATLSYDTNKLSIESKIAGANFTDASGSNSEIAILSSSASSLQKEATLYTITFKVLETAEEGNTTISVKDSTLALVNESSVQENIEVSDANVVINITQENEDNNNEDNNNGDNSNEDNNNENNNNGDNSNEDNNNENDNNGDNSNENNNNEDNNSAENSIGNVVINTNNSNTAGNTNNNGGSNNTANTTNKANTLVNTSTKLPQTGIEKVTLIAIITLAFISIISYVSYKKYKNI